MTLQPRSQPQQQLGQGLGQKTLPPYQTPPMVSAGGQMGAGGNIMVNPSGPGEDQLNDIFFLILPTGVHAIITILAIFSNLQRKIAILTLLQQKMAIMTNLKRKNDDFDQFTAKK
jgi:hypothetical protein